MKVIATFSPKGGSGKSTITATLATLAVKLGHKVCVYDNDPQLSITEYLNSIDSKLKPNQIESDLKIAPEEGTEFVFVDCEPTVKGFIPTKDFLIIAPTLSSRIDIHSYRFILEMEKTGYDIIKVINKFSLTKNSDKAVLEELSPCAIIRKHTSVEFAMNNSKTIWNVSHPTVKKARNEFLYLWDRVLKGSAETLTHKDIINIGTVGEKIKD